MMIRGVLTLVVLVFSSGLVAGVPIPSALAAPTDVAAEAGVDEVYRSYSVASGDFNEDGWDEWFFVRHNPQLGMNNLPHSKLFRNERTGSLSLYAATMFGRTDKHGCAWGDYDEDRDLDLACAIGWDVDSKNELWRNDGRFTNGSFRAAGFTEVGKAKGLWSYSESYGTYRYVTFFDANGDGYQDLYFARDAGASGGFDAKPKDDRPNELWINKGPTAANPYSFRIAPGFGLNRPISALKDSASCVQDVNFDSDGDRDLLVCGQSGSVFYRNNGNNGFTNETSTYKVGGTGIRDAGFANLDGDSALELAELRLGKLTIKDRSRVASLVYNTTPYSLTLTGGESLAFGDFDGNGYKDVYVLEGRGGDGYDDPDFLLLNQGGFDFSKVNLGALGPNGAGDDVAELDYNRDGKSDFVVTNGDRRTAGPVQLWTDVDTSHLASVSRMNFRRLP